MYLISASGQVSSRKLEVKLRWQRLNSVKLNRLGSARPRIKWEENELSTVQGGQKRLQISVWDGATSPWLRASLHMSREKLPVAYHRLAASGLRYQKIHHRLSNGRGNLLSVSLTEHTI